VKTLYIGAVGSVPFQVLNWIESAAAEWFAFPIRCLPPLALPETAYDVGRGQYRSVDIMKALAQTAPPDTARLLGVTEVDLAIPMLSFLFGQAQLDGSVAVISLCRLRQAYYGLPTDDELLRQRTVKEALHELGHTFGLTHCPEAKCAMSLATHIGLVDQKAEGYCGRCGTHLAHRLAAEVGETI
jgi:archaemetzincin